METKKCPYCGQEIKAVAKKCRFCGKWLDEESTSSASPSQEEELSELSEPSFWQKYKWVIIAVLLFAGILISLIYPKSNEYQGVQSEYEEAADSLDMLIDTIAVDDWEY